MKLISIICLSTLAIVTCCSSPKPATYIDKSNKVYNKKSESYISPQPQHDYPKTESYNPIGNDSSSEIVESKLSDIGDTQQPAKPYAATKGDEYLSNNLQAKANPGLVESLSTSPKSDEPAAISPFVGNYKIKFPVGLSSFEWPLEGKVIGRFGKNGNKFNEGIFISAPLGTPVVTVGNGKVIYIGKNVEGYGNLLIIKHDNDLMSAYAHLKDIVVERNATVKKGESIGSVGQVGNVDQPQLHFSIRKGKKTINPEVAIN